jgi:hypothetical protein
MIHPGTADLIELLERLDSDGHVSGPLCKYAQLAYDRAFIRIFDTLPEDLDRDELFRAHFIAAEVTDEGHAWMDERLGLED